jgi:hypothetical protein
MARSWLEMRRLIGPQREGEFLPSQRQVLAAAEDPDISEAKIAALKETEEQRDKRATAERLERRNAVKHVENHVDDPMDSPYSPAPYSPADYEEPSP